MKLKRLDLKAFGPFTDRVLEFNSKGPGLHVIFGPNEAGKSSALRGLKALLFGFHSQTPDNFLHSYENLLVGGLLENGDGQELFFQRRKKRINDLLDGDGAPLDAALLAEFLHGVEPDIFESLYGIDHHRLVEGGKEILAQQGEVGRSLFAAGAGISSLRNVITQLDRESSDLFKPQGSKPEINRAIKRFKELQRELKEASLAPRQWKELNTALEEAKAERHSLEQERDAQNRELRRLERLERALPELASLKVWRARRDELGDVVPLPPDIRETYQQTEQALNQAKAYEAQGSERLKRVDERLRSLSLNHPLLEQRDVIDDFHQRLGEYRKGQKDRPERNGMRINLRTEAALLLKHVRPDVALEDVDSLRPMLSRKRTVQSMSSRFEAISQNVSQTARRHRAALKERKEAEEGLSACSPLLDTHELAMAVELARKAGTIDDTIHKAQTEIDQGRTECRAELQRIGLWTGDMYRITDLPLPLPQTLQKFEKEYHALDEERRALVKERQNGIDLLSSAEAELKKIQYGGDVPSEQDLHTIRDKRDTGWHLLRCHWLEHEDVSEQSRDFDSEKSLPDAFEGLVIRADIVADRLRNEADRVLKSAHFKVQVEQQKAALAENSAQEEAFFRRTEALSKQWNDTWKQLGITPLSPGEMNGWLTAMEKLRYRVEDLSKKERNVASTIKHRQELIQRLHTIMRTMGVKQLPSSEDLAPVLICAETLLEDNRRQQNGRERLRERLTKARKNEAQALEEHREAEEALTDWKNQWHQAVVGLGFKEEIAPFEAMDHLDTLHSCLEKEKEAAELQKRIDGIDRDADRLAEEVQTVLRDAAPGLMDLPLDQAILQLRALLTKTQEDKALHDQLSEERESLLTDISTASEKLQSARAQMEELCRSAQCKTTDELGPIISRFLDVQELRDKISTSEETLARIGAGATIEELTLQAEVIDADEIPISIESLQKDIEERVNPAINAISQKVGEIENARAAMDGSSRAADASEKMEQELAKIRRLAERYIRVTLASRVLQQEIERYREKHQDPVLQRASHYFAELTLSSFSGLRADVNDKGEPVLEGVRQDGSWTGVSGMSDGTRDQLYLALRLATLEWRMETSDPMPFIVDDILINFDDERSRATLEALARFSRNNQVILFTHHHQLVDDARRAGKAEEVIVHMLEPARLT